MRALNPAYKLLTLIIASLMLSVTYNTRLDLVVAGCCLVVTLCTPRVDRKFLFISLTPFLIAAFGMFMTGAPGDEPRSQAGPYTDSGFIDDPTGIRPMYARLNCLRVVGVSRPPTMATISLVW